MKTFIFQLFLLLGISHFGYAQDWISKIVPKSTENLVRVVVSKPERHARPFGFTEENKAFEELMRELEVRETGTAFPIEIKGRIYLITCAHVIDGFSKESGAELIGLWEGEKYNLILTGADSFYDIAVLRFARPVVDIKPFQLYGKEIPECTPVVGLGLPHNATSYHNTGTVLTSVQNQLNISKVKGEFISGIEVFKGCSGGPVFNSSGKVVGMIARKVIGKGASVIVSATKLRRIAQSLIEHNGRLERAYFGLEISQISKSDWSGVFEIEKNDLIIGNVTPNSPSEEYREALIGAQLLRVDGKAFHDIFDLLEFLEQVPPQSTVSLEVKKRGRSYEIPVQSQFLTESALTQIGESFLKSRLNISYQLKNGMINLTYPFDTTVLFIEELTSNKTDPVSLQLIASGSNQPTLNSHIYRIEDAKDLGVVIRMEAIKGGMYLFGSEKESKWRIRVNLNTNLDPALKHRVLYF